MNLTDYETLLKKTAEQYRFEKINTSMNPVGIKSSGDSICFLRHDIDFDPVNALRLAEIEVKHGAVSTYTVLLSGQYYSPFEKKTKTILRELNTYGHEIGLHFDPTAYEISTETQLDHYIRKEREILQDLLSTHVSMFSFHNTTDFSMSCRNESYGGLVNAYSHFFHEDVEYTSDSNGYWRFRTWEQLLSESHKVIQVLTHPIWWLPENQLPPFETVVKNCFERFRNQINDYNQIFHGQVLRTNISALNEYLHFNEDINNASQLNTYAQHPQLIEYLNNLSNNSQSFSLQDVAKEFLKK
jgi:hypothetical protein